jgi:hypothetical protein
LARQLVPSCLPQDTQPILDIPLPDQDTDTKVNLAKKSDDASREDPPVFDCRYPIPAAFVFLPPPGNGWDLTRIAESVFRFSQRDLRENDCLHNFADPSPRCFLGPYLIPLMA